MPEQTVSNDSVSAIESSLECITRSTQQIRDVLAATTLTAIEHDRIEALLGDVGRAATALDEDVNRALGLLTDELDRSDP